MPYSSSACSSGTTIRTNETPIFLRCVTSVSTSQKVALAILDELIKKVVQRTSSNPQKGNSHLPQFSDFPPPSLLAPKALISLAPYEDLLPFSKLLLQAHESNQHKPLSPSFHLEIKTCLKNLITTKDLQKLLLINKLIATYTYGHSYSLFKEVLFEFKKRLPALSLYFKEEDHVLTPKALNFFFAHQKQFPEGLLSCHFFSEAAGIIERFEQQTTLSFQAVILRCDISDHLLPLFMKKDLGQTMVAITDSLGQGTLHQDKQETDLFDLMQRLLLSERLKNNRKLTFFCLNTKRQADHFSCPAFCLKDLKNMIDRELKGDSIFHFLADAHLEKKVEEVGKNVFFQLFSFSLLPPDMMSVTQSLSHLKVYSSKISQSPSLTPRSPYGSLYIRDQISPYIFYESEKQLQNKYVEKELLHLQEQVLTMLVPTL